MTIQDRLGVNLIHDLPGRLRVRLSHAPKNAEKMRAAVLNHAGFKSFAYTHVTRSVLIHYDPNQVTRQEILFRIALSLSLEYGTAPVRILTAPEKHETSNSATLSAFLLFAAVAARVTKRDQKIIGPLELGAGLFTAYSVLDHGWREIRERGYFDPEVLSIGYLLTAFIRGGFLKASVVTWLMTFGRHILETPKTNIEVRPIEIGGEDGTPPRYEVVVGPDLDSKQMNLVDGVKAFIRYALTGGAAHGKRNLLNEFRDVSRLHGEVMEGLGRTPHGVPMRFR